MPNIFQSIIFRRFLAHILEIGSSFAITLILLQVLSFVNSYILNNGDFFLMLESNTPNLGFLNSNAYTQQSIDSIYQLIFGFALFYFVYSTFNFFFTFSVLYPRNDFKPNLFQRMFGFKKYDFGKKKLSHLQKALQMLFRETILFSSIYGFFSLLAIFKVQSFFDLFFYLTENNSTIGLIFFSLLSLFIIFVLPTLLLCIFSLYKTKGKQFFWDYITGITLK